MKKLLFLIGFMLLFFFSCETSIEVVPCDYTIESGYHNIYNIIVDGGNLNDSIGFHFPYKVADDFYSIPNLKTDLNLWLDSGAFEVIINRPIRKYTLNIVGTNLNFNSIIVSNNNIMQVFAFIEDCP